MRAGACSVPQTLSPEAASVLKHSLVLARRRGHAQLTPLHVASTLLASSSRFSSTLRRTYLKSSSSSSHPDLQCRALELCFNVALNRLPAATAPLLLHASPSLSNALIASLKRAQAHQRRTGSAEQQQLLLQQQNYSLVAIRVELDQLILSILDDPSVSRVMREAGFSSTLVKSNLEDCRNMSAVLRGYNSNNSYYYNHLSPVQNPSFCMSELKVVFDVLLGSRRKNVALVGGGDSSSSSSMAEGLAEEVVGKFEKGDADVPEELRSVKLIRLQFSTVPLRYMKKQEVDMNVGDLRRKVESFGLGGRVIIYIGDLKWAVGDDSGIGLTVDYLIEEIGKLVSWFNGKSSSMRVWLMGTANYDTYMKCKMKLPVGLDVQWDLEQVCVTSSGTTTTTTTIGLSGCLDSRFTTTKSYLCPKEEQDNILTCCPECISNFEKEINGSAQLPYWLKPHVNKTIDKEYLLQLRRKYKKHCQNLHQVGQSLHNSWWPNKNDVIVEPNENTSSLPRFRRQPKPQTEPNLDSLKTMEGKEVRITLSLGNSSTPADERISADDVIRENVPWQCETIPSILDAVKEDRLLLIQGNDVVGKRRLAAGLAKSMFGSSGFLFRMNMTRNDNASENREMLEVALRNRENIVVLVEDVDYADPDFVRFLVDKNGYSCRAIFILTTDNTSYSNVTRDGFDCVIRMKLLVQESKHGLRVSNLDRKRKSECDNLAIRVKNHKKKLNKMESEVSSNFEREQSNSNALDLNLKAGDDDEQGKFSPISSDLTREITIEHPNTLAILEKIKNRFVFNRDPGKDEKARDMLSSMFKRSFHEATDYFSNFEVGDSMLEEILKGSGFYLNDLFEKWLKDIFRTSLIGVVAGVGDHREKVSVRLCLDGKLGESCEKEGFMGTCLPKRIQV